MCKFADITPFYEWLDWLEKESNSSYHEYQTMMFYEIRDKLDDLPTIEVPTWIPVTERLPKHGAVVLAYTKLNDIETFQWDDKYEEWLGSGLDNDHWKEFVTHWMPLPTPPKDGDL